MDELMFQVFVCVRVCASQMFIYFVLVLWHPVERWSAPNSFLFDTVTGNLLE